MSDSTRVGLEEWVRKREGRDEQGDMEEMRGRGGEGVDVAVTAVGCNASV